MGPVIYPVGTRW